MKDILVFVRNIILKIMAIIAILIITKNYVADEMQILISVILFSIFVIAERVYFAKRINSAINNIVKYTTGEKAKSLSMFFWSLKEIDRKVLNFIELYKEEMNEKNHLIEEKAESNKILETLVEINEKILEYDNLDEFFEYILGKAVDTIGQATHGALMKVREDNMIDFVSIVGFQEDLKSVHFRLEDTFLWVKTNGKVDRPVMIDSVAEFNKDRISDESKEVMDKAAFVANHTISAPIKIDGKLYGMINVDTGSEQPFKQQDVELMKYFAEGITIAIKNKLLLADTIYLSKFDSLTGVFNRGYFESIISEYIKKAARYDEEFTVVIFDLNYLKKTNDVHGHAAGDKLLKDFAQIINNNIRKSDVFARFGGDEFVLLLLNASGGKVQNKLVELKEKIAEFNSTENEGPYDISYSFGIASFPNDGKDYDTLIKIADSNMYIDKKKSRC